jgi:hypothetical protein
MINNEEDLVSAHRERLLARKLQKEKIENSIRTSFLTDINRDQINEINKRLSNLFRNYINKQNQIISEEKSQNNYIESWKRVGIGQGEIHLWQKFGVSNPACAASIIELFLMAEINLDLEKRPNFEDIKEYVLSYLEVEEPNAIEVLLKFEETNLIKFSPEEVEIIYNIALAYFGDFVNPNFLDIKIYDQWVLAEKLNFTWMFKNNDSISEIDWVKDEIIDEYIDRDLLDIDLVDKLKNIDRNLYFRARTKPEMLSDKEVSTIGWEDESLRREFLRGKYKPEMEDYPLLRHLGHRDFIEKGSEIGIAHLQEIIEVSSKEQSKKALDIINFIENRVLTDNIEKDTDVWRIALRLGSESCYAAADPYSSSRFKRWCFYRMTHFLVLNGDKIGFDEAVTEDLYRYLSDAKPVKIELLTGSGLLNLQNNDIKKAKSDFKRALETLSNNATTHNRDLVQSANYEKERLNPFVVMGTAFDDPHWRRKLRAKKNQIWLTNEDEEADLSWAAAVRDNLTSVQDTEKIFVYPASPNLYATDPKGTFLHPNPIVMERRSSKLQNLDALRNEAFRAIIPRIAHSIKIKRDWSA